MKVEPAIPPVQYGPATNYSGVKHYLGNTWNANLEQPWAYLIRRCICITSPWGGFPSSIARQPTGCQYRTTRAGPANKRTMLPKALAPPFLRFYELGLENWKPWPWHNIEHSQKKTTWKIPSFFLSDSISPKKKQKHQLFHTKFVQKSSFPIKMKFGGDNAEDWNIYIISIAQFATHQEILPKFDSIYKSSVYDKNWGKWHFCDAPLNFTVFDLKNKPHMRAARAKKCKQAFVFF